ncbi:MAG: PIG-L deacetylase family protein [Anaerolineales bacterium]|jgi:LmbE family N-acetylglucosaminyl deacetylase
MKVYIPESAMAIVAHPDDIEFTCAGTLARWAQAGAKICYVLCTSGEVGISKNSMTREEALEIREAEQRKAAEIAGAAEVIFLRYPDGMLEATMDLRKDLVRQIRRFKPEVIVTGDPAVLWASEGYINHPDHRAAAQAALDAAFPAAGQPHLFQELEDEGLVAHKVRKIYAYSRDEVNEYISIDDSIEVKIQALRAHASQMKDWDPAPYIKERAADRAKGLEAEYAEAFRVVTLESDEDWSQYKGDVIHRP